MTHQQGPDRVFEREVLPELDAVYRFALRLSSDPDRARDLTQETFLRAYRTRDRYAPGTRARSWLFTICRNLHLREGERGRRHAEIVSTVAGRTSRPTEPTSGIFMEVPHPDPEDDFWSRLVDAEVLAAVDALSEEFRVVVVLSDIEGLSQPEVADVLDIPIGTVKSRLFRARRLLRDQLREYALEQGIISESTADDGDHRATS